MITEIGRHRVQCQDVMMGIDNLMRGEIADFVYSDPPWGQGNLTYWQTINKRHTGREPKTIDYGKFLPHYFQMVAKYCRDLIVIEYGIGWRNDVIHNAEKAGFKHGGVATGFYKAGANMLPLDFHIFSKSGNYHVTQEFIDICSDNAGQAVVHKIFAMLCPKDAKIILDPMCGMGYTAQAAIDAGYAFRGNELNEKRLSKTIARLQKKP